MFLLSGSWATLWAGIRDDAFQSKLNRREVAIQVFTPPGYEKGDTRYPVVYNLHGGGGSPQRQWERMGKTVEEAMNGGRVRPVIYVVANGLGDTLFLDYADGSLKVESMIVRELIPYIDQHYRTIASSEGRAIDGFSMGGFGALLIAFRHPTLFSSVVSYGAAMLDPAMIRVGGENGQFPSQEFVARNSPWGLLEANKDRILEHLRIRMVCGDKDEKWYPGNVKLKQKAGELKVPVEWVSVEDVGHDTKGLYERVGFESLQFIERGLAPAMPRREGLARDLWYWSELNRREIPIKVYTPPDYESSKKRYPVVYNLHGAGGGSPQRQWSRTRNTLKQAVETGQVAPLIYVFVDGLGDTFFLDYADGSVRVESSITKELVPFIDRTYRTLAEREHRAIDGFSMGGSGALRIALANPELFGSVVSYGAALIRRDTNAKLDARRYGDEAGFAIRNPWPLLERNADAIRGRLRIRMVCGDADRLFPLNVEFQERLRALRIPVEWIPVAGVAHDTKGLFDRKGVASMQFITRQQERVLLEADLTAGHPGDRRIRVHGGKWETGWLVAGELDRIFIDLGREVREGYVEAVVTRTTPLEFRDRKRNWFGLSASREMNQAPGGYARAGAELYGFSKAEIFAATQANTICEEKFGEAGEWKLDGKAEHTVRAVLRGGTMTWSHAQGAAACGSDAQPVTHFRYVALGGLLDRKVGWHHGSLIGLKVKSIRVVAFD
jgi:endo-1,4-beta-xylanase